MTRLINLTPHDVNVQITEGEALVAIPPSGKIARVSVTTTPKGELSTPFGDIPLFADVFGEVEGLPVPVEGTFLIVSGMVAAHQSVKGRADVLRPGDLIRDENKRVIGCKGLKRA